MWNHGTSCNMTTRYRSSMLYGRLLYLIFQWSIVAVIAKTKPPTCGNMGLWGNMHVLYLRELTQRLTECIITSVPGALYIILFEIYYLYYATTRRVKYIVVNIIIKYIQIIENTLLKMAPARAVHAHISPRAVRRRFETRRSIIGI